MLQILVVYYSRTGRTRALAESVAAGVSRVEGAAALLKPAAEVQAADLLSSAGIIAGCPVYFGGMPAALKDVFDRHIGIRKQMAGKIGAAFATSNHHTGGKETTLLSILQAFLIYGMIVTGDPMETGGHYGLGCAGQPDAESQNQAALLGLHVAKLAKQLASGSGVKNIDPSL